MVPTASVAAESTAPPAWSTPEDRLDAFEKVSGMMQSLHVFGPRPFDRPWSDELAIVRDEVQRAASVPAMERALSHLQNSLHDPHLYYVPASLQTPYRLPLAFDVDPTQGPAAFYVTEPVPELGAETGDQIVSYQGVRAANLAFEFRNESPRSDIEGIQRDVARYLSRRKVSVGGEVELAPVDIAIQRRRTGVVLRLRVSWQSDDATPQTNARFGTETCGSRAYPSYALRVAGVRWCLYTSDSPSNRRYPIVLFHSFLFVNGDSGESHGRTTDDLRSLAAQLDVVGANGVLLDLRANRGGNDSNLFLGPWAPRPFSVPRFQRRLHPLLRDPMLLSESESGFLPLAAYDALVTQAPPGAEFSASQAFSCSPPECDSSSGIYRPKSFTPRRAAVLVGPGCGSACATFAQVFEENHFGPLVGQQPSNSSAFWRIRHPVPRICDTDLGTFAINPSRALSGLTGEIIGSRPLHLDLEMIRTFENRASYDQMLVDAAISLLQRIPAP